MKKICLFVLPFLLGSCIINVPTRSVFVQEHMPLNAEKKDILTKYGLPFRTDAFVEKDSVLDEVLYYKEGVRVMNCPFIITTKLFFKNGRLEKILQTDKMVTDGGVQVDSID